MFLSNTSRGSKCKKSLKTTLNKRVIFIFSAHLKSLQTFKILNPTFSTFSKFLDFIYKTPTIDYINTYKRNLPRVRCKCANSGKHWEICQLNVHTEIVLLKYAWFGPLVTKWTMIQGRRGSFRLVFGFCVVYRCPSPWKKNADNKVRLCLTKKNSL
jgi:hypothetical protein